MIRLFTALCKVLLKKVSEEQAFCDALDDFSLYRMQCPRCGAVGKLSGHGIYRRNHVSYIGDGIVDYQVSPCRVKCSSCGTTHALLPDTLTPYSPYTLSFKLMVLIAYYEREATVVDICSIFGIAASTLYQWKKLIVAHKEFMLGVLISRKTPALAFMRSLLGSSNISDILHRFFRKYGFSFMQGASASAAHSVPP